MFFESKTCKIITMILQKSELLVFIKLRMGKLGNNKTKNKS